MKGKYQYTERIPTLSDNEIDQHKDFRAILDKRTEHLQGRLNIRKKLGIAGVSILILGAISTSILLWSHSSSQKREVLAVEIKTTQNAIVKGEVDQIDPPKIKRNSKINQKPPLIESSPSEHKSVSKEVKEKAFEEDDNNTSNFQMGYERAVPIVGADSLSRYLNKSLQYPDKVDKSDGIEGSVHVIFSISKQGEPANIEIRNSLGKAFDQECYRLINNMPKWKAAKRNGEPVESKVSVQLSFKIDKESLKK